MVLPVTSFVSTRSQIKPDNRPLFNENQFNNVTGSSRIGYNQQFNYRRFWHWFKKTPELNGIINVLTTDIIGDRPDFTKPDGTLLGRNKRIKAFKFWRDNRVKETLRAILFDMFITGDGYGWIARMDSESRNKFAKELVKELQNKYKFSTKESSKLHIKIAQDEDLKKPKRLDYLASSTVTIESTPQEILGYWQRASGFELFFKPPEVVHFRLNNVNGMVRGWSPFEAMISEIVLLSSIKENMLAYFRNGGSPQKLFVLPEEMSGSDNHQFLVQTLQRYNLVENRNGNLVFTGKVDVEDLSGVPDLQQKDLALWAVSNMALAYNIPVTRLPFLIGTSANKGDTGGIAESGYWNMISEKQDMIEDLLNSQVFEPLGFNIKLNRKYKQDEVREAQTFSMNADTITKIQSIIRPQGKTLTVDKMTEILKLSPNDFVKDSSMSDLERNGMMNQNMLNNMQLNSEPDKLKRADTKRNSANQNGSSSAAV